MLQNRQPLVHSPLPCFLDSCFRGFPKTHWIRFLALFPWIPAFAGMTEKMYYFLSNVRFQAVLMRIPPPCHPCERLSPLPPSRGRDPFWGISPTFHRKSSAGTFLEGPFRGNDKMGVAGRTKRKLIFQEWYKRMLFRGTGSLHDTTPAVHG